jgi:predicted RNA-binding protein (TIGR00451 family)
MAIGQTFFDSNEVENMNKGKIIKNLHYIKDQYYQQI